MPRKRRSEDIDGVSTATSPIKTKIENMRMFDDVDDLNGGGGGGGEVGARVCDDDTTVNSFAEDTSMLGFRYLHTRYKTWFRILWACVLIFFIGLTVYQVFERITYYFIKNPLATRRSYETLPKMYFPTIGVCNKMQMKASSIAQQNPELLRAMCNVFDEQRNENSESNATQKLIDQLDRFDDVDILTIYRRSFQTVEDLIVSCEFGKSGSCQDEIRPIYTPNGLCFAVSPNKTILRPGPETTLSLILNLEVHDIIPGSVVEPGVILSIYDGASSLSHYSEGIHLEAGKVVTIPVNEVRKLKRYETKCGTAEIDSFSQKEYSKAACEWSVNVQHIEKECQCVPMRNPVYRSIMSRPLDQIDNESMTMTMTPSRPPKKWRKVSKMNKCTIRQEIECVQEKLNIRAPIDDEICPDDCEDISFSSIVFGGNLSPSEIVSQLPSDWEDMKEKRVAAYQKALEVIPNKMIPVVRNVQQLANELQNFVESARKIFGSSTNPAEVKCLVQDGRTYESLINQFNAHEPIWERITTYLHHSLARELNATSKCIGLSLDAKGEIIESKVSAVNISLASISLLQLDGIETSLTRHNFNYGLAMMHENTRRVVVELVLPLIREVKDCVTKMYDNTDRIEEIAQDCRLIFKKHYKPLISASHVYTKLSPTNPQFKSYSEMIRKLLTRLQSMKKKLKMSSWKNFDIDLKEFEAAYRDDGRDHLEIEEMLKLRKMMISDIAENAFQLNEIMSSAIETRSEFAALTGVGSDEEWTWRFANWSTCFKSLHDASPILKKSRFIRGEWLSRLRNQVLLAQSYSPTPQYDVVNLLHIKFYFAHFKQETILQERSYNMFLLLAEIGGTIGLYVGATLLTVAETLVFFFERKTRNIFLKPEFV